MNVLELFENKLLNYPYLSFQKVSPKINYFDSKQHTFYLYCYLDPFNENQNEYQLSNGDKIAFGFEPLYIGKASSNHGYRHNQHIAEFLKGMDSEEKNSNHVQYLTTTNLIKMKKFKELETNMKKNKDPNKPNDWTEYQKNWIIVLKSFDSAKEVIEAEKIYIRDIGTLKLNSGPLTNGQIG